MISARENTHLLFGDMNIKWIWKECELVRFREMWNEGIGVSEMAKTFKCNRESIALLVIDQGKNNKIKQRKSGLQGMEK